MPHDRSATSLLSTTFLTDPLVGPSDAFEILRMCWIMRSHADRERKSTQKSLMATSAVTKQPRLTFSTVDGRVAC